MYKVEWNQCTEEEAVCNREEDLKKHTRSCGSKHQPNLKDEIHFKGSRIVTP